MKKLLLFAVMGMAYAANATTNCPASADGKRACEELRGQPAPLCTIADVLKGIIDNQDHIMRSIERCNERCDAMWERMNAPK